MSGRKERRERAVHIARERGVAAASVATGVPEERIAGWLEQAARPRAKRADVATRRRAVARAGQVGDARAAEEFEVAPATIRSWRRRVAGEPVAASVPAARPRVSDEGGEDGGRVGGLEGMRRARDAARAVEAQAVEQTQTLLAAGQAREAQAASVAGGSTGSRRRRRTCRPPTSNVTPSARQPPPSVAGTSRSPSAPACADASSETRHDDKQ
jgi:hypothetical protein